MFELKLENRDANIVDLNDGERYEVIGASGFDPPSASLFTSKSPNRKGAKHNGSTLDERVVLIRIKLLGDVEESRNSLYAWTDPEQYAKIHFKNGAKRVYCEGYVAACSVDMFSNNEVMNVEILCGDPYLKDMQDIAIEISKVVNQFVFPFAIAQEAVIEVASKNPDGTNAVALYNKGIPFSTLKADNITNIFNSGAETGAQFIIRCIDPITSILIFDANDASRQFKISYSFPASWQIIIDTEASPKTCKAIKPDGTMVNALRYVKGNPSWFMLKKGINRFGYSVEPSSSAVEISVAFTNKYLGV